MMMLTAWQMQQARMGFSNNNHGGVSFGMPHQNNNSRWKQQTIRCRTFSKASVRMKEETERVQGLVKNGVIKPLPDKEGVIYDIPDSNNKKQNNKKED